MRGAINIKKALPSLRGPLEIKGPGASKVAVRRSGAAGTPEFRVFNTAADSVVTISGLTISNGRVGSGERGSGAFNRGTLTIRNSTFSNNGGYNTYGAGIDSSGDTLTIKDSTFSDNYADGGAGGIDVGYGSRATVERSKFVGNTATESDGGIGNSGTLTVEGSTFSNNKAFAGGGIYNHGKTLVVSSTLASNSTTGAGGGVYNESPDGADFHLRSTIVAKNQAPTGPDASGAFRSGGYNLIGNPSEASGFGSTDLTNTRSGLDPRGPRDNGGPTKTIALVSSSPAVDAVPRTVCPPPSTDQRGVRRPQDGDGDGTARCDIGAYERRAPVQYMASAVKNDTGRGNLGGSPGIFHAAGVGFAVGFIANPSLPAMLARACGLPRRRGTTRL